MGDEKFEGYTRLTEVLGYFKSEEYWEWVLKVGKKEAKRIGTTAQKIGTNVDEAIKATILEKPAVKLKTKEAENCFKAYERWIYESMPVDLEVGTRLFDEESKVTGEPDLFTFDTLIDVKCSNQIRPEYWLQTEWYARMLKKPFKAILRLDKDLADYEFKKIPLNEKHWRSVQGLITTFEFYKQDPTKVGQEGG